MLNNILQWMVSHYIFVIYVSAIYVYLQTHIVEY